MKKLLLILGVAVLLTVAAVNSSSILGLFEKGEYSVYGLKTVFHAENVSYRDYKTFTEARASLPLGAVAALSLAKRQGESVALDGSEEDFEALVSRLSVKICERQVVSDVRIIYGYTERLAGGMDIDGKLVNIELAYRDGKITVGTPIILGSY